jgi:hypothetical protein
MALSSPFLELLVARLRGRDSDIRIEIGCGGREILPNKTSYSSTYSHVKQQVNNIAKKRSLLQIVYRVLAVLNSRPPYLIV